jgi:pyruvate,water dikinase
MRWVIPFEHAWLEDITVRGGDAASSDEPAQARAVPPRGTAAERGFALAADAFRELLLQNGLLEHVFASLDALDVSNVGQLSQLSAAIRVLIRDATLPKEITTELVLAYRELSRRCGEEQTDVVVRSSAPVEDGPFAPGAGQDDAFEVRGEAAMLDAVRRCMISLFTERAIAHRAEHHFDHRKAALSVCVQQAPRSDLCAARRG